jgi:hypothetical protein
MEYEGNNKGIWTKHRAVNYGCLRFESAGVTTTEPRHVTHRSYGTQHRRQTELSKLHAVQSHDTDEGYNPTDGIYTSAMGVCCHALSKHVRRLVVNIPDIAHPANFDCTEPTDLIVAIDGSVLLSVRYHSWLISTEDEHTLLHGGGPDNGAPLHMTSYGSKFGGICAGLEVIGVLDRSGRINIRTVLLLCDKKSSVTRCNQKLTSSIYHSTESDWDLLKTFHSFQDECCK